MMKALAAPFDEKDLEWRVGQSGFKSDGKPWLKVLAYVNARAIMDRLDTVVGPENWSDEYRQWSGGVVCRLSIKVGDHWVYKEDGSEETQVEGFKGAISKALVRTGVKWGIGRYLYDLPVTFAEVLSKPEPGSKMDMVKDKHSDKKAPVYWKPPRLKGR